MCYFLNKTILNNIIMIILNSNNKSNLLLENSHKV